MNIENRVITLIAEHLNLQPHQVALEKTIAKDLGADSLDMVEIVMAIEDEFSLEIPDEDAEKISTVQQAIDAVTVRVRSDVS